jgi:CRISPR/Cas system CSM-associated protein Csm3 (group 7 of RAMP superfamily)
VGDTLRVTFDGIDPAAPNPAMATKLYTIEVVERGSDIPFEVAS